MALRQLAGPFSVVDETGNPPTVLGYPACYVPYMGIAIACVASSWSHTGMLAADGVITQFADSADAQYGWDPVNRVILSTDASFDVHECVRDPRSWMGYIAGPATAWLPSYAKLADRRIYADAAKVYSVVDGVGAIECSSLGLGLGGGTVISAGRNDHEVFIATQFDVGGLGYLRGRFYDFVAKAPSSPVVYIPVTGDYHATFIALFSQDLGLIFTVTSNSFAGLFQLSLWSLEPLPASVVAPVLFRGSTAKGNVAQYRCQVVGDQGEPCTGELVDWSIVGPGVLLDQQGAADAGGFAVARVFYRLTDGGDSTVTAGVRC